MTQGSTKSKVKYSRRGSESNPPFSHFYSIVSVDSLMNQDFMNDLDSELEFQKKLKTDPKDSSFDSFYRQKIAQKIDSSEFGRKRIKQMNKEITQIKKILNEEMAKTKRAEK